MQMICFLHLHVLATLPSLQYSAARLQRQHRRGSANLPNSPSSLAAASQQQEDDSHEAEAVINDLITALKKILEALKGALSSDAAAAFLSPICSLIPKILLRYA